MILLNKKILILLLFIPFMLFSQQTKEITLSNNVVKTITIPQSREELEDAYIRSITAYLEESISFEELLIKYEDLEKVHLDIDHLVKGNEESFESIINELKKKDPYSQFITVAYNLLLSQYPDKPVVHGFSFNYNGVIYERFIVGGGLTVYPDIVGFGISLNFGVKF